MQSDVFSRGSTYPDGTIQFFVPFEIATFIQEHFASSFETIMLNETNLQTYIKIYTDIEFEFVR